MAKISLRPLGDRVLVKPVETNELTTKSGLLLPDSAQDKSNEAEVVAVGPGKFGDDNERIPLDVKVGDRVVYKASWGDKIKIDGTEYDIISVDNVLAVFEKERDPNKPTAAFYKK